VTRIAFIGLGAMGSRIAGRLADAGNDLIVWNRTAAKAAPLSERGATVAESPAAAAQEAEVVITMVTDPDALSAVVDGPTGALAGAQKGSVLVDMSTVGPEAVARLADELPDGVDLVDAPVLGSLVEAESGALTIFVGGRQDVVDRVAPVLEPLGRVVQVGPLGQGAAAKLVANSTLFGVIGVLGEALALADALGLSRDTSFEVLTATALADQAERRREAIESGDYPRGRFPLPLAHKDAKLVLAAAAEAGIELKLARAAEQWLAEAEAADPSLDYSAVLAQILAASKR